MVPALQELKIKPGSWKSQTSHETWHQGVYSGVDLLWHSVEHTGDSQHMWKEHTHQSLSSGNYLSQMPRESGRRRWQGLVWSEKVEGEEVGSCEVRMGFQEGWAWASEGQKGSITGEERRWINERPSLPRGQQDQPGRKGGCLWGVAGTTMVVLKANWRPGRRTSPATALFYWGL